MLLLMTLVLLHIIIIVTPPEDAERAVQELEPEHQMYAHNTCSLIIIIYILCR